MQGILRRYLDMTVPADACHDFLSFMQRFLRRLRVTSDLCMHNKNNDDISNCFFLNFMLLPITIGLLN